MARQKFIVTSPQLTFDQYISNECPLEYVGHVLVGDLRRLKAYAERGWQEPVEIPDEVWEASERLIQLGYDRRLPNNS